MPPNSRTEDNFSFSLKSKQNHFCQEYILLKESLIMKLKPQKWLPAEVLRTSSRSPVASQGSCLCSIQSLEISSLPSTEFTGIPHSMQLGGLLSPCQCQVPSIIVLYSRKFAPWIPTGQCVNFFGDVLFSFFFLQLYLFPIRKTV